MPSQPKGDSATDVSDRSLLFVDGCASIGIDSLTAQKRTHDEDLSIRRLPARSIQEECALMFDVAALRAAIPVMLIRRRAGYMVRPRRRWTEIAAG